MNTYDPHTTLEAISHNAVAVIGIGGLSIVAMFVFFVEGAWMGRRGRVYPDSAVVAAGRSYLLRFGDWFGGRYNHWFAIIVTFLAESVYAWQTFRYGREELSRTARSASTPFGSLALRPPA